jgi:acetyl-CoA C-acetyltransferase
MPNPVHIIGAARTDFKRNFRKEGKTLRDMIVEAGRAALADAGVEARDIQSAVVGNFAGGLYTRQLHLGSFITDIDESLRGIPTLHTEAACASGGVAVLTGAQQIMGGLHDLVLVVGAEQQKTMSPAEGADVLAAAGDVAAEKPIYGEHMFPKLFGRIAQIYKERYGLSESDLARVAARNHANARRNPLAQMRDSTLTLEQAAMESEGNRMIAPPLKLSDCSQITDGAAAIVLSSNPGRRSARLLGYGHATDHLPLERKEAPEFPIARLAAKRAFEMARLTPTDIQAAEVHDCFSISQILALEILGIADSGKGATKLDGPVAINPGGGLIGDGHPVGATGVRQICEAFLHLTDQAGARQVEGAKHYLTFNMGGTMTTSVVTIWGR